MTVETAGNGGEGVMAVSVGTCRGLVRLAVEMECVSRDTKCGALTFAERAAGWVA